MKRLLLFAALVVMVCGAPALGALTYGRTHYNANRGYLGAGNYNDPLWNFWGEIEDIIEGTTGFTGSTLYVVPQSADPGTTDEGRLYYDSDNDNLYVYANGGWVDLTAGAGTPAGSDTQMQYNNNGAFGAISTIIWDDTNLEFANDQSVAFGTEADWTVNFDDSVDDQLLWLTAATAAGATTDPLFEIIVGASPDADQQVFGVAKGTQSSNTALLTLDEDGDFVVAGTFTAASFTGDVTLSSAETITNTTDTEIAFTQNGGEDIVLDMDAGSNAVGLKSSTGVDELAMGAVDDLTGVGTIAMDAAAASVSLAAGGDAQDFTVSVTGATNSSLILSSEGTAEDALQISTSAGGMNLTVAGAAASEDLDLISNTSINLTAAEASDAAVHIQTSNAAGQIQLTSADTTADGIEVDSSGGIDIDAADDITIDITSGGADEDILITQTGANDSGIILEAAGGTGADAIGLNASGTGGGISADTDDGAISIVADGAANGDITIDAQDQITIVSTDADGTDSIYIHANGGASENIKIHADQGTGVSALQLLADAGTVDIDGVKATVDTTDDLTVTLTSDSADEDLTIQTSGATDNHVKLISTGTSADAMTVHCDGTGGGLDVDTDDGAISIVADGAANGDITIDAQDKVTIVATDADGTDSIYLHANGGTSEVIKIHADQGNAAGSILLLSDAGGITLNASSGVVFTNGQTRKLMFHPKDVELDGTNPPTLTDYGTDAQTNISALDFDADGGGNGDDICYISWMVPDGYVVDSARLNIGYTFDTAEDGAADEAQFDFTVNSVAAGEALDAAGTDLLNQTTVIADATADNGKLHITQYDIEVEDIAVDDLVTIEIAVDESASGIDQGNFLVLYLEIEWESTE